jgi:precorrin-4 methylase
MNDGVLLSLDFVDARAFSLSLSALSALSLSLFSVDLQQTTTLLRCASKKKKAKKSVFFLETTTTTTKAWTTTRSIRDARDVLERMKRNTSSEEEGVSVKQRVSKEDVLVSTISKDGEFSVVETFETPSKADEEFLTLV